MADGWKRREMLAATGAIAIGAMTAKTAEAAPKTPADQIVWTFDRLTDVGGRATQVEGAPKLIDSPWGKAVQFDGVQDVMFIDQHPLAGAKTFTFEAVFRPDGGATAQRWFHLAEDPMVANGTPNTRFLFEIRVDFFKGAVREARFTPRALAPEDFHRPRGVAGS